MKDTLIKEILFEKTNTKTSVATNALDKEYNDSYNESYQSLLDKELEELKKSSDIGIFVHKKIVNIPQRIKSLVDNREDNQQIDEKAKMNSEIDVLNILNTKYMEASSKLAIR
jgi:hypothetical protein